MLRRPYLEIVQDPVGATIDVGTRVTGQHPALEGILGGCVMVWTHVEAEMALFLGHLLGAQNSVTLAVFQAIRRSNPQRSALAEAAKLSLDADDYSLFAAVFDAHKVLEDERNALTHGHFGTSTKLPEGLVWMNAKEYLTIPAKMTFTVTPTWDDDDQIDLLSKLWVYRAVELQEICDSTKELSLLWFNSLNGLERLETRAPRHRKKFGLASTH